MLKEQCLNIVNYMRWANLEVLKRLEAAGGKPEQAKKLFFHILAAEKVWLARLTGSDSSVIPIWPELELGQCRSLIDEIWEGFRQFFQEMGEDQLNRPVSYRTSTGVEYQTPVADIMTHVSMHGHYHRGQISREFRLHGIAPVNTDYIAYTRISFHT